MEQLKYELESIARRVLRIEHDVRTVRRDPSSYRHRPTHPHPEYPDILTRLEDHAAWLEGQRGNSWEMGGLLARVRTTLARAGRRSLGVATAAALLSGTVSGMVDTGSLARFVRLPAVVSQGGQEGSEPTAPASSTRPPRARRRPVSPETGVAHRGLVPSTTLPAEQTGPLRDSERSGSQRHAGAEGAASTVPPDAPAAASVSDQDGHAPTSTGPGKTDDDRHLSSVDSPTTSAAIPASSTTTPPSSVTTTTLVGVAE